MLPDGGEQIQYKRPCYAMNAKNRLELRVPRGLQTPLPTLSWLRIADDPIDGTLEQARAEASWHE